MDREINVGTVHELLDEIKRIIDARHEACSTEEHELVPASRVQRMMGISKSTMYKLIKQGKLTPGVYISPRCRRWEYCEVLNAIADLHEMTGVNNPR